MANDFPQQNKPKDPGSLRVLWILGAFIPSILGITSIRSNNGQVLPVLILINFICSIVCAGGTMRGSMKNKSVELFLAFCLAAFFFVFNLIIVVFVGCSGPGAFAP
jgi:hypothetical protein